MAVTTIPNEILLFMAIINNQGGHNMPILYLVDIEVQSFIQFEITKVTD
jgi:hypothetical protein